jgi:hypothetical protein
VDMAGNLVPADFAENRRSEPRIAARRTIELLPCRATTSRWSFISAELADCSLHGLSVVVDDPMDVGHQFLVKLHSPPRRRLLLYTVQNCTAVGGRHRLGARFSGFAAQEFDEDLRVVLDALTEPA